MKQKHLPTIAGQEEVYMKRLLVGLIFLSALCVSASAQSLYFDKGKTDLDLAGRIPLLKTSLDIPG